MSDKGMSSEEYLKYLLNKRMALRGLRHDAILRKDEKALDVLNEESDKVESMIDRVLTYLSMEVVING